MAKSIKKLLSLTLALVMVLSMIPAVFAADETEAPAPAYTTNAAGWVEIGAASQFNKWFYNKGEGPDYILVNATEAITAKLVLTADIKQNVTASIGSSSSDIAHNIILDLNGHTITATHASRIFALYKGSLTIMNSKDEGGIIGTGANNSGVVGSMLYAAYGSTLNLVNVNITRTENTYTNKGGGVLGANEGATINIIDCVIDGALAGYSTAGGVLYIENATVNLFGSVLKNGTALSGGIIRIGNLAVVNMYSGEITGGQLPAKKFTAEADGTFADNAAGSGAGVYVTGTGVFNMYGGEIHDNTSAYGYSRGGNIYVFDDAAKASAAVFNMYGGKIYNGDAMLGDNIYTYATKGTATVNFFGGEVGAAKNPPTSATEKPRHNIFINKAMSVANVYGGTFLYNPHQGSSDATVNFAECAVYTEATEETPNIYTHGVAGETVAATCVTPGYTVYSCETCQQTWNVYTDLADHTPVVKEAVEATCIEDGLTEGAYCSVCNYDLIPQLAIAGGHAYEESYVSPTEMDTVGTYVYTCACGDSYEVADTMTRDTSVVTLGIVGESSESAATGRGSHIMVRLEKLDPEKTKGLVAVKVYSGEQLLATTVRPADRPLNLEFAPVNIEINRDTGNWNTTWEEGMLSADIVPTHFEAYYGDLETVRGIFALDITAEAWAAHPGVANGGQHYPGEMVKENEVAHTCTEAGSYEAVVTCTVCALELSRETVEVPAAHAWDEGVYTEPTTEADGYTTFTCTACGETKTEIDEGSKLPEVVPSLITKQPESVNAETGTDVQFHVEVEGDVVSYKWEYRKVSKWYNTTLTGYNTDTLTVGARASRHKYDYRCVITFADGTVLTSEPAELTVNTYINITSNPSDQTVVNGYKGQFTVKAEGEDLKYRWYYQRPDGTIWMETDMEGNTKQTVMIESAAFRNGYKYKCKITDAAGLETWSEVATMRVLTFTSHPVETFAPTTGTVQFTVTTSVPDGFTYQWQYRRSSTGNWTNTSLTGYNTDTLTVPAKGKNNYEYRCIITGSKNSQLESKGAVLHVGDALTIIEQPTDVTAAASENAVFHVEVANAYSFQWKYNKSGTTWSNTSAEGFNTDTLTVAAKGKNGYKYRCHIKGLDGTELVTDEVTLTVG